jgi:KTSC domain-containing protein
MKDSRSNPSALPESAVLLGLCSVAVSSNLLARVAYDAERAILQLEFCSGGVYEYFPVPLQIYHDLLQADSCGVYFNHHIRGRYPYTALRRA